MNLKKLMFIGLICWSGAALSQSPLGNPFYDQLYTSQQKD